MNEPSFRANEASQAAKPPNRSSLLMRALLAYSIYEHSSEGGIASRVEVQLKPRSCALIDNGRGIGLHRDGYVASLVEQLALRQPEVALHGLGLAMIATACPRMTIESRRDGLIRRQEFSWGVALGEVSVEPFGGASGTCIAFTIADESPDIDFGEVSAQADHWRRTHPALQIDVLVAGADAR
jgi:hypothetical protein